MVATPPPLTVGVFLIPFRQKISRLSDVGAGERVDGMFNVSALGRYLGISPGLMQQYQGDDTQISDARLEKIETGLYRVSAELAFLSLVWFRIVPTTVSSVFVTHW